MTTFRIIEGDCREGMATLADESVHAVVTDPPYELGFMGRAWDSSGIAYDLDVWREALRVLKPGGHVLAFGGSRTWHRLAVAIEDAGFEMRDTIAWIYGSGFPKSHAVDKHIDRVLGAVREPKMQRARDAAGLARWKVEQGGQASHKRVTAYREDPDQLLELNGDEPATPEAAAWRGWGTALKPALEPIAVGRKPLIDQVATNVLEHGTGAYNVAGCRIGDRWPSNVMLDELAAFDLDRQAPGAHRFFYVAKASTAERSAGLDRVLPEFVPTMGPGIGGVEHTPEAARAKANVHPTVKPIELMRELVRLVTPPGGTVLDPFTGSGSTGIATLLEGFTFVGCELSPEYAQLARRRIAHWNALPVAEQDRIAAAAGQQLDLLGDLA